MNLPTPQSMSAPIQSLVVSRNREILAQCVCLCSLLLAFAARGQVVVTDNFNDGNDVGWVHYEPGLSAGQTNSYTFPGGTAYRMYGPPAPQCQSIINRGGSYRTEQYTEFFQAVDVVNFDPEAFGSFFFLGSRIATPGALTTQGYIVGNTMGGPRARQEFMANIEFSGEITATILYQYRGGTGLTPRFPPSRKFRMAFSGINDTLKAELYDRTDLLEPFVRVNFVDFANPGAHASGENVIGWLNLDFHERCDFTVDNYHSTGNRSTAIGFPGTAQVIDLTPAPQRLFYQPPQNGSNIVFNVTTFTVNQINTNSLKLFLNGADVTSQLRLTEIRDLLLGSPNTNFFVRYTGSLSANTVYRGTIIVLDTGGQGTTNNWYFDTFANFDPTNPNNTTGFLLVEAEDYNYNSGQFQDYPKVSGTDDTTIAADPIFDASCLCTPPPSETLGPQVNGAGVGYYNPVGAGDVVGAEDVDYHESSGRAVSTAHLHQRQHYRSMDRSGIVQGVKGGGFDTPRTYRSGLTNVNSGLSYVPDYIVGDLHVGDWMNYTRTFPNSNYIVYLRTSSQGRQDVRFDQVTSDPHITGQTTALRGQFLVPNTEGITRFRYVPLTDEAGNVQTLAISGTNTFRLTANQGRREEVLDVGDLQLNWLLFVPTASAATSRPWIASALPSRDSVNFAPDGVVNILILDRGTSVNTNTIQLKFDGTAVSASIASTTNEGPGTTVSYDPPGILLPGSVHTNTLVFSDGTVSQTNEWSFTVNPEVPLLLPSDAFGGLPDTLFTVQMHKATNNDSTVCTVNGSFGNSVARGEHQLTGRMINPDTQTPFDNEAIGTNNGFYSESRAINYEQCAAAAGFFGGDTAFPGIDPNIYCPSGGPNNFAMAATIKLQLSPGIYRMGVNSDDGFRVTAGGLGGTNVALGDWETIPGTRGDGQFDFVVQSNGVYKLRLIYEEGGGSANCEWYWINRSNGTRRLVSTLAIPASYASPLGFGSDRGFTVQMAKARNDAPDTDFVNTPQRAEDQLAGLIIDPNTSQPYTNEAAGANNGIYPESTVVNYDQSGVARGFFSGDRPYPGVGPTDPGWNGGDPNHMALAATTYLELTAGRYILGVRSDDGFRVTAGPGFPATNLLVGAFDGDRGSSATEFEFVVVTNGLYPFRLLQYENVGGADVEWYSVDPTTGATTLINDAGNPNSIKAYQRIGISLLNPRASGGNFSFDIPTSSGRTYTVQFKDALTAGSWTDILPAIVGDGSVKTAGPYSTSNPPRRFYRVKVD